MSDTVLALYVPVLHSGYINLFKKYKGSRLYLVANEIIRLFPKTAREIRAIAPDTMGSILRKSGYFSSVIIAGPDRFETVKAKIIIQSGDAIGEWLKAHYFARHNVKTESIFLRYDENVTKTVRQEIEFDGEISNEKFDRQIIEKLNAEKVKSGDYFLQVAAAIVLNGKIIVTGYNQRMPTAQAMLTVGDPRNFMAYGTDSHQRTVLHAEQRVLVDCARQGIKTEGKSLYVTTFPCPDCASCLAIAGIEKLYFEHGYSLFSAMETLSLYKVEVIKVGRNQMSPRRHHTAQ